jgi:hypothetical protein
MPMRFQCAALIKTPSRFKIVGFVDKNSQNESKNVRFTDISAKEKVADPYAVYWC